MPESSSCRTAPPPTISYLLIYQFQAEDGKTYRGKLNRDQAAWNAARVGETLDIRYVRSNPRNSRDAAISGGLGGVLGITGAVLAVIGALFLVGVWLAARRASRAPPQ